MNPANATFPAPNPMSAREAGYVAAKRGLDIVSAGLGLLFFAPAMLVIALIVCIDSPGGALFRQERVGRNNSRFFLLKFRSMRKDAPNLSTADMQKQTVSPITRVGAFLRRTSLDELPQLI
ncbi:MAG: sugar transferase, partial [Alphaproteobacteria bacterium]